MMKSLFISADGKIGKVAPGCKLAFACDGIAMQDTEGKVYELMETRQGQKPARSFFMRMFVDYGKREALKVALIMAFTVGLTVKRCPTFLHHHYYCFKLVDEP
jgi:hypothetical protein